MNEVLNKLTELVMAHNDLMIFAHKNGLQGIKRFNRLEMIENMKRVQEIENYYIEYKMELPKITYNYSTIVPNDAIDLLKKIRDSRKSMITILETAYNSTNDLSCKAMLSDYESDFRKEWQIYNREIEKVEKFTDVGLKWEEIYKFDACQHEYIKHKED